jgi:glycerophosphoryl diester phosphodiesterase
LVFAHRGGAKLGPENTLTAFDRGIAAGADGLELDVRLSKDGEVVVIHDATLDRVTDVRGPVRDHAASDLAKVNVLGSGEGVPLLRDVLNRYPNSALIVEMKEASSVLARRVVDVVREAAAIDRVALGSFYATPLRTARRDEPRLPTGSASNETRLALYASYVGIAPFWARYKAFQVPERTGGSRVVSTRFVRLAHQAGLVVQVWVVDAADDITRLLSCGVDAIISDRPDIAVDVVRTWAAAAP